MAYLYCILYVYLLYLDIMLVDLYSFSNSLMGTMVYFYSRSDHNSIIPSLKVRTRADLLEHLLTPIVQRPPLFATLLLNMVKFLRPDG